MNYLRYMYVLSTTARIIYPSVGNE